ncbi:MAG: peptidoglycan editing factor PgeF [Nitrospirales bacterium]
MDSLSFPDCIPVEKGFDHFFGTRQSPAPLINILRVGQVTPVPPDYPHVISLKQVHGKDVAVFDKPVDVATPIPSDGDALVTNQPNVLLVVRTADCVPVLMVDVERRVVAAVHAGWRGAVAGIVPDTLLVLSERFGSIRDQIRVAIGPSIGPCCFEVDEPVLRPLKEQFSFSTDVLKTISSTHAKLDLKALIRYQLTEAGIEADAMRWSQDCTQCDAKRFFSYRREGQVNGTMISGIMMKA